MTAITKAQLDAASLDAESLALFTNGAADAEVLTRLGATYPTVKKLVSDIYSQTGYLVPVAYTSGISLTTPNQTVEYGDVTYAPIQSQLPFTTSGTFETAKFRVVQGVTFAELNADVVHYDHIPLVDTTTVEVALRAELKNVNLYFIAGESDHTGMFNRASAASRRVYVPAGTYDISSANFPADTEFFGDGEGVTIIRQKSGAQYAFTCDSGSNLIANNIKNLKLTNLQLRGTCDTDGFSEHVHLLNLNGVSDVTLRHVEFKGFRGDAIYLGSSNTPSVVRYNSNVKAQRCKFDGINKANRNAISVITIDGIDIDGCEFANCTAPTMPGAIDLEPNDTDTSAEIKNVTIRNSRFKNIGGNVGAICIPVSASVVSRPENIRVLNNKSETTGTFFYFNGMQAPTASSAIHDVIVQGNSAKSGSRPFAILGAKGIKLIDNTFLDFTNAALIGYTDAANTCRDIDLTGTRLVRCGSTDGNGLMVFSVDYLKIDNCDFVDCATGLPGASVAINFYAGTSSNVSITNTRVASPLFKTAVAIQKEAGHTFTPATNKFLNNDFALFSNSFKAEESDAFDTAYTPVVAGDGTAGAGVYTGGRVGRFRRAGKTVFFRAEVNVSAGHTGAGGILVSLPYPCVDLGNGEQTPVALSVTGVSSTGGQVGLLHPYVTIAGAGCVRLFQSGVGGRSAINMPAGAFTINVSGSYIST